MNALAVRALAVAIAVALAVGAWNRFIDYEQQIGYDRAVGEMNADKLQKIAEAQSIARSWRQKYERAQDESAKLHAKINRLAGTNANHVADIGRLRVAINNLRASRVSDLTTETCPAAARTLDELFGDCAARIERLAGRYAEVATTADRHATDAEALDRVWPETPE